MKSIEKVGKTVDDAITEALIELGASTDQVHIEIISKGSKGLLGFGAKSAKVKVTLKEGSVQEVAQVKETIPEVLKEDVKPEVQVHSETVGDSEDTVVASKEEVEQVMKNANDFLGKLLKQMDVECTINSEIVNKKVRSRRKDVVFGRTAAAPAGEGPMLPFAQGSRWRGGDRIPYYNYSLLRMILPLMVLGSSVRNSTIRGYL